MRKINKGFTLIELLVVVAIIGILASVGVVAYNGYTGAAKASATKAIHAQAVKFIASETKLCTLGETHIMVKTKLDASGGSMVPLKCPVNPKTVATHIGTNGAVDSLSDMNPYDNTKAAVQKGEFKDDVKGQVTVIDAGGPSNINLVIKTCLRQGCSGENVIEDTISIE